MSVSDFLKQASAKWICEDGPESDIVISTRIRVARNLVNYPFPMLETDNQADAVINEVERALQQPSFLSLGRFAILRCRDLSELERQVLVEKHLISPNLAQEVRHGAAALRDDEVVSIMINEEDHLRIQCIVPGLQIFPAWQLANEVDDALEQSLDYAFDEKHGYLTACPTNVGTGIRASVMMHLPGLVLTNQIHRILQAISKVGLVVRGLYGEGSEATGNLFQISNQLTLGQAEPEILGNLEVVTKQILEHERQARKLLLRDNREQLADRVCRSFGILAHARSIDSKETMQRLSDVRLGIDLGIIRGISSRILKELMVMTSPAFLQKYAGQELTPGERDWRRASMIRERLRMDEAHF